MASAKLVLGCVSCDHYDNTKSTAVAIIGTDGPILANCIFKKHWSNYKKSLGRARVFELAH